MSKLHVWTADKQEWVIAESAADARDIYCEVFGMGPSEGDPDAVDPGTHASHWDVLPDEQPFKLSDECQEPHEVDESGDRDVKIAPCPKGCGDDFIIRSEKTCGEWARDRGRGYLASADI